MVIPPYRFLLLVNYKTASSCSYQGQRNIYTVLVRYVMKYEWKILGSNPVATILAKVFLGHSLVTSG